MIKVEKSGAGDVTREQLRDIPDVDSLYFTMLNHNKRSVTLDTKSRAGQACAREAGQALRRAGGELRAGGARSHGLHLGANPGAQSAHDRRLRQGLRPRPLRGLQGLRERGAVCGRFGLHHRLRRRSAARDRCADRRQRHRIAPGARHRRGALPAQDHGARPEGACRHAGRRPEPVPREAARSAAAGAHSGHEGVSAVSVRQVRQRGAARGQCLRRRPTGHHRQMQGLGDRPERLPVLHRSGAGVEGRSAR